MKDKSPVGYPKEISAKDRHHVRRMINSVRKFVESDTEECYCIQPSESIAISCSAGIDSMCLADILYRVWRISKRNPVVVLHVNHGLRPKENPIEHALLQSFCSERNLSLMILDGRIEKGTALQERARNTRYNAIYSAAKKLTISNIFIAHNKNDSIESIIIRTFQGRVTSNAGDMCVFGIRSVSPTYYEGKSYVKLRPLLSFTRGDIERYMRAMNISWHEDSSNGTDDYLRNYIRHNVMPHTFLGNK